MDHFEVVGSLALGSRLKRLSDYLMQQARDVYADHGIDFDPRWFPLFSLLSHRKEVGITEAAQELRLSHPQIIKLARELEKKGLLQSSSNPKDARSRILKLSPDGLQMLAQVKPLWHQVQKALEGIFPEIGVDFLAAVRKLEDQFEQNSLCQRVSEVRDKEKQSRSSQVSVVRFNKEDLPEFVRLNREWVSKYFVVEPCDESFFQDPVSKVMDPGGEIFFAKLGDQVVGTVAMLKDGDSYELSKMAVDEKFKGFGIGNHLMNAALEFAQEKQVPKVYLMTNDKLLPAIRLYEKFDFVHRELPKGLPYERANVFMEKWLDDSIEKAV